MRELLLFIFPRLYLIIFDSQITSSNTKATLPPHLQFPQRSRWFEKPCPLSLSRIRLYWYVDHWSVDSSLGSYVFTTSIAVSEFQHLGSSPYGKTGESSRASNWKCARFGRCPNCFYPEKCFGIRMLIPSGSDNPRSAFVCIVYDTLDDNRLRSLDLDLRHDPLGE